KPGVSSSQTEQTPPVTVPQTVAGSTDDPNSETIRQMLRRIEELETRIKGLEARQVQTAASPNVATGTTSQQNTATEVVTPPVASPIDTNTDQGPTQAGESTQDDHLDMPSGTPHMRIQGFADVDYRA